MLGDRTLPALQRAVPAVDTLCPIGADRRPLTQGLVFIRVVGLRQDAEVKRVGIRASTRPTMASATMKTCCLLPSFAAALVASYWFLVEIALRGAVTPRLLWHGTAGATPRHSAMTAEHRRAKTPDRILRRAERRVSVLEPVPLRAFPWRGTRRKSRTCPERRCYNQEPRTETDTNKKNGRSELDDAPAPPSAIG